MSDMTSLIKASNRVPWQFQSPITWKVLDLNFGDAALADMKATGTHNILTLAAGDWIVGAYGVVYTSMASTSNDGTIVFQLASGDALKATITADGTEAVAGDSFNLLAGDFEDTATPKMYSSTATTLDMVIGTHAITAGRIFLVVGIINVANLLANG